MDTINSVREGKEKARAVMAASLGQEHDPAAPFSRDKTPSTTTAPTVNGESQSRKRSRSGSRIPTQPPLEYTDLDLDAYLVHQAVTRDQHYAVSVIEQALAKADLNKEKVAEKNYYVELKRRAAADPGSIYGYGFEGFGNGRTDTKPPRILYPAERARRRRARDLRVSREKMSLQADQLEELVPVRLDFELDKIKLRDTFTWNLHDRVTDPLIFAETMVEDLQLPPETTQMVTQHITREIQEQLQDHYPHVFIDEEPHDPNLPYYAYKNDEMRVLIKLNIQIGPHTLVDQFEWEINNPHNNPEDFARQMAKDMSLSGEFVTAIAHSIREQCQLFTKSLYITGHPFDGRPIEDADVRDGFLVSPLPSAFRPMQSQKDYAPYLYELSEAELQREEMSILREQRRQKRSVNRRGGPALPDLKDRQRTVRTLVVSSVIPGAANTLESSRLYKLSRAGRNRKSAGRADEDSEDSDSEESVIDSPAPVQPLPQGGTARQRAIRGAASAAQVAMRANLGRSQTPEVIHHHETRTSARKVVGLDSGREESVPESATTTLIVKLHLKTRKGRDLLRNLQAGRPGLSKGANTPQPSSAPSSMPPPPSPAASIQRSTPGAAVNGTESAKTPQTSNGTTQQWRYDHSGATDAPYPQPRDYSVSPSN